MHLPEFDADGYEEWSEKNIITQVLQIQLWKQ